MIKKFFSFLLIIAASFIFYACSDDPTSVGLNQIPGGDLSPLRTADTDSLVQTSFFYKDSLITSAPGRLIIGRNGNAESIALLSFYTAALVDSFVSYLNDGSLTIKSATVILKTEYSIGSGDLPFRAYKINDDVYWSSTFNRDSVSKLASSNEEVSIPGSYVYTDSLISFGVNTGFVMDMMTTGIDTSKPDKQGIYLQHEVSTGQNRALGFNISSGVSLQVIVQTPFSSADTIDFELRNAANAIKLDNYPTDTGLMYVQGGVFVNTALKFYFPTIPDNAIINKATLELPYDSTRSSFDSEEENNLAINFLLSDSIRVAAGSDTSIGLVLIEKKSSGVFSGDITTYVQEWFDKNSPRKNNGLKISFNNSVNTIDLIALISAQKESQYGVKPKIKIIYSIP